MQTGFFDQPGLDSVISVPMAPVVLVVPAMLVVLVVPMVAVVIHMGPRIPVWRVIVVLHIHRLGLEIQGESDADMHIRACRRRKRHGAGQDQPDNNDQLFHRATLQINLWSKRNHAMAALNFR
jgi:hypothetical protein